MYSQLVAHPTQTTQLDDTVPWECVYTLNLECSTVSCSVQQCLTRNIKCIFASIQFYLVTHHQTLVLRILAQKILFCLSEGKKAFLLFTTGCNTDKITDFLVLKSNNLYGDGKDTSGIYSFFPNNEVLQKREQNGLYLNR